MLTRGEVLANLLDTLGIKLMGNVSRKKPCHLVAN